MGEVENLPPDASEEQQLAALQADGVVAEDGSVNQFGSGTVESGPPKEAESTEQEGSAEGEEEAPGRPDWLPEKYSSPEEFAKGHRELVKLLGKQGKVDEDGNPVETPAPLERKEGERFTLNEQTLADLGKEWGENEGKLTDASYEKLKELGLQREVVDTIARAQVTQVQVGYAAAFERAGIDTNTWEKMRSWAEENLSDAELSAFNEDYLSPTQEKRVMALKALRADYLAVNSQGSDGSEKVVDGKPSGRSSAAPPITSQQELTKAQADPRYDSDPAYRAEVDRRVAAGLGIT